MKMFNYRRDAGFTLIEILLAMAIFGLVLTAIYASWTAILRASKVGLEAASEAQRERVAIRTIEEALTASRSFAADLPHYGFVAENGSEAVLSFVARLPKSFPRSGKFGDLDVRRVSFSVESGQDSSRQLVLRQTPIFMDFDEDEKEHPLVLAKYVKELQLGFWDTRTGDWADEWNQTNSLPRLMKITLRLTSPNQGYGYSQTREEVTRLVSLPSITVPVVWQMPNLAGSGAPPPPNVTPGIVPPTNPLQGPGSGKLNLQ
jgi:general secretion pathway protein J